MERKWSIRAYRDGDEEGILELWKAVYPAKELNREQWLKQWHWMYKNNPAGSGRIWLAEDKDRIVGQYAVIPVLIKLVSKTIIGALSLATMTHPAYRHQGLFETLAKKTYAEVARDGIHIVYGFPNELSYPGFIKKLNWFDITTMQSMFRPLNWESVIKKRIKNKFLSRTSVSVISSVFDKVSFRTKRNATVPGLTITQISSFDESINEFLARVSNQCQIMVARSKDHLNWRYVAVSDTDYMIYIAQKAGEIHGYITLRCMQQGQAKTGVIFDILAQSEHVAQCLIWKCIEQCEQKKVDTISCNMIASKMYFRAFKRNGFISMPFKKGSQFCAYSSAPYVSKEFLQDAKNWFVQYGDSDQL
jgi:N-acetylglutamate synthase-like GNAT family acetyltransferase